MGRTKPTAQTVATVVEALGGRHAVAELCLVTYKAVSNWIAWNRFPERLHLKISRECERRGIKLPDDFFESAAA